MKEINLIAVGDILLSGEVAELIQSKGIDEPFKKIKKEFSQKQIIFGNLETPLTNSGKPIEGKVCLRSPPEAVKSLTSAGFTILSLANNHIFDFGFDSFEETTKILNENNLLWFGAGKNIEQARKAKIVETDGITFGFLGYAWNIIDAIDAKRNKFGTVPLKRKIMISDIKNLKPLVDIVVVSLHWGYVGEHYPLPSQRKLAQKLIDVGASVILGSHPHVIQGIEDYNQGVIVYSFGNFMFPDITYKDYQSNNKQENKESFIFDGIFTREGIKDYKIIPLEVNENYQPYPLTGKKKEKFLEKVTFLSRGFKEPKYKRFWKENRIIKNIPDLNKGDLLNKIILKFALSKLGRRVIKILNK